MKFAHKALKKKAHEKLGGNLKENPAYPKFKKGGKANLPNISAGSDEAKEMMDMGKC